MSIFLRGALLGLRCSTGIQGRTIDHSTFGDFRTKFKRDLKDLFRQIGRVVMQLGLISLNQVALDGTRVRADSSRRFCHGPREAGSTLFRHGARSYPRA